MISLGKSILNISWQHFTTDISLVLNNFIKNIFTAKSRDWRPLFDKLHPSRPYNNAGMHFDLSSCMTTARRHHQKLFISVSVGTRSVNIRQESRVLLLLYPKIKWHFLMAHGVCGCEKSYESWLTVDKVITVIIVGYSRNCNYWFEARCRLCDNVFCKYYLWRLFQISVHAAS